jgi:hypothetical protein
MTRRIADQDEVGAAMKRFAPQPYIQLARTVRGAGYEAAANEVFVRLERNRTRYSGFGVRRQLGRWILDFGVRYGFSPFRPLWILLAWAIFSAGVFEGAYHDKLIVPTNDNEQATLPLSGPDSHYIPFSALIFAVDSLVPVVDLNQKRNWMVKSFTEEPNITAGAQVPSYLFAMTIRALRYFPTLGPAILIVFNTFFGWLMTTLFAAGITGLLRSGREDV